MHLPKNIPLKATLLTLALAASHVAHAATFQDEAIAFATNNPMSLTVQGDDVTVNLTTNVSLLPGVHVEQNEEAPCPIGLTTSCELMMRSTSSVESPNDMLPTEIDLSLQVHGADLRELAFQRRLRNRARVRLRRKPR